MVLRCVCKGHRVGAGIDYWYSEVVVNIDQNLDIVRGCLLWFVVSSVGTKCGSSIGVLLVSVIG